MQLSEKRKRLSEFIFLNFLILDWILNIFKKKMTLIADGFLNLQTPKNVIV